MPRCRCNSEQTRKHFIIYKEYIIYVSTYYLAEEAHTWEIWEGEEIRLDNDSNGEIGTSLWYQENLALEYDKSYSWTTFLQFIVF